MDSKRFDALTRGFGAQRTRRDAVKAFAAGLMGFGALGAAKTATAQVSTEEATCGQDCDDDTDCNAGLRCSEPSGNPGLCVAEFDSEDPCDENEDCDEDFEVCRDGDCVNQSDCRACNDDDGDCPGNEVCRNDRCGRDRDECDNNNDCRRRERCRRGRCVRRNRR